MLAGFTPGEVEGNYVPNLVHIGYPPLIGERSLGIALTTAAGIVYEDSVLTCQEGERVLGLNVGRESGGTVEGNDQGLGLVIPQEPDLELGSVAELDG